jgi:hypothetical protein
VNKFKIFFSNDIAESSLLEWNYEIRIESENHPEDIYNVMGLEFGEYSNSEIIVVLDRMFTQIWERFNVTVLRIQDVYGQSIAPSWIDTMARFVYNWETEGWNIPIPPTESNENNNTPSINVEDNTTQENNNSMTENPEANLGWTSLNAGDVENQVNVVAGWEQPTKVQTGPEHVLMLIFALLLGGVLYIYRYRKS